jgi:cysteine desulfurase
MLRDFLALHGPETALISVMWANNEVGSLQPVAELASIAKEFGVPMHSDAVQAVGAVPVGFAASGLSAASVTAHKFGGPPGAGVLLLGRDVACAPLLHGGGHERDVRSGTVDVPAAAGMAAALRVAVAELPLRATIVAALRNELIAGVRGLAPGAILNGPAGGQRLPGNAHFIFPGCEGDSLLMLLDAAGIECSTGSACTAGVPEPSHVLLAMGVDAGAARGSLRFSLGHSSTRDDVHALLEVLPSVLRRARAAGMASSGVGGRF